jgi:predicted PurR-regulated permease PerM
MIETIIILGIMVVILGYTTINLLFKNEQTEDIIVSQQKYISSISEIIKNSEKRLREIDEKEVFKSDDEIGWFFNEIKKIQNILTQYKN